MFLSRLVQHTDRQTKHTDKREHTQRHVCRQKACVSVCVCVCVCVSYAATTGAGRPSVGMRAFLPVSFLFFRRCCRQFEVHFLTSEASRENGEEIVRWG